VSFNARDSRELPGGPVNLFARLIAANPPTSFTPHVINPDIDPTAFVGPFATVIGDVRIGRNVFIGPTAVLRADEGTPFFIGNDSNVQDGVILHGLKHETVKVDGQRFSIYVGAGVTCAHGALVHGPVAVGDDCFIGFHAIVFDATLKQGVYVSTGAVVTGGVRVAAGRFVPPGALVDTQAKADALSRVPADREEFAREVQRVNQEFPASYSLHFGAVRCSCGIACD
jgi:carbonic anhydrase/acetyltransferase-like protein (isoleucine patch superfamily)